MRTVYLGTSSFAAAVLERVAATAHRPQLIITRPDARQGRGRRLAAPPVAEKARGLGLELLQPERLHDDATLARIAAAEPEALCVCAYGALIREPLLSAYEILNVHPSLLPRWRGAAPVERAIMAGDERTGVSIMRLVEALDAGPVCLRAEEPIHADDDYGTLAQRLQRLAGDLLVRALDERPPFADQDEAGVTYAHKIEARDRTLDFTRPPEHAERTVRALRPHIGARVPLPDGEQLGVIRSRVDGPTLAPAGGRVHADRGRLLLDCNGGALELTEIRPPGGRAMAAADWLRGRPGAARGYLLDPTLPERPLEALVELARGDWSSGAEWAPYIAALAYRGGEDVLDAAVRLADDPDPAGRGVAACLLGQLSLTPHAFAAERAAALERMAAQESDPDVLAAVVHGFGHLGEPYGLPVLLELAAHPAPEVREGVAMALAGREQEPAVAAMIALSHDDADDVRDWATFALGTLAPQDTAPLRDALADRLADPDPETRTEAVHGLAVRGDVRAVEPALELLAAAAGDGGGSIWRRHQLRETAERLSALTGDSRFAPYLPAPGPAAA